MKKKCVSLELELNTEKEKIYKSMDLFRKKSTRTIEQ